MARLCGSPHRDTGKRRIRDRGRSAYRESATVPSGRRRRTRRWDRGVPVKSKVRLERRFGNNATPARVTGINSPVRPGGAAAPGGGPRPGSARPTCSRRRGAASGDPGPTRHAKRGVYKRGVSRGKARAPFASSHLRASSRYNLATPRAQAARAGLKRHQLASIPPFAAPRRLWHQLLSDQRRPRLYSHRIWLCRLWPPSPLPTCCPTRLPPTRAS